MPTPSPKSNAKNVVGIVVILSVVLILLVLGVIWKSTEAMFLMGPSATQDSSSGGGSVAGMPPSPMPIGRDDYSVGYAGEVMPSKSMPPIAPGGATPEDRARIGEKIIRNGSLTLRVDDAAKRLEELRRIVENVKGFVANANITDNANIKTAYVTVRVPNDKFDEVRQAAKALATTVFVETENAEDVTAQFVDLDARLKSAKAEEQQYLEILKKAGTIEDTLDVTQRLADVRARIEQMQGQLRYMNDQTTYATLSITLTEEAKVEAPTRIWKPLETFNVALRDLVISLQGLADSVITVGVFLIGMLLPIALAISLIAWIVMKIIRRVSKK